MTRQRWIFVLLPLFLVVFSCLSGPRSVQTNPAVASQEKQLAGQRDDIEDNSERMLKEGRETFRYDTFGSEEFWAKNRLHEAILGEKQGGVGPGLKAIDALKVGLKVDIGKLPKILGEVLKKGSVSLENPETTLELLKADAVVGVKAIVDRDSKKVTAIGIRCDDFQASRSPDKKFYRTTPLAGLFTRAKGGFYHDGRFADYRAVVKHYDRHFGLRLSDQEKAELIEYLKSL
ncbi:MAG: hypothetical protein ABR610_08670 [Thermoanaerobaculia bacterium]